MIVAATSTLPALNSATVSKYAPGATTPYAVLSGLTAAQALAIDGHGDVFVADSRAGTISEFAPGVLTPGYTVNDGNGGNNYTVATVNNGTGSINPALLTVPAQPLTKTYDATTSASTVAANTGGFGIGLFAQPGPKALAVDPSGNLFVAYAGNSVQSGSASPSSPQALPIQAPT